ncbi:MAG: spermidine synthase [Chloroflexota bacterium]
MRRYLYFTVFTSGMTVLALEMSASRLLGNAFGTSNLVWASIIGLILIYLAAGYTLGGRWADRSPHYRTFYAILLWGAFTAGLVPLASRPVLRLAADAFDRLQVGVLAGSFTAVLVLFTVPITLLGMISPFAIRLAISDPAEAGRVSGRIYALSTLGSFIGTFVPVLALIPLIGTAWTFVAFSELLMLTALVGLWLAGGARAALRYAWMPLLLLGLALWFTRSGIKASAGQIYETESAYNYIQVLEQDGYHILRLNEGQGQHSMWHPSEIDFYGPWEQFLAAPFFNASPFRPEDVRSVAIVGLAAGTAARQATAVFGPIPIDGFEIDPEIIRVGREYFDMRLPNLNAIAEDGRTGLRRSRQRYSLVVLDAYRPPYIPPHLTTREFFQLVYDRLDENGALALNVGRSPNDRRLIEGLTGTIESVFPSVYVMDVPGSFNSVIYATRQPSRVENLYANLAGVYARTELHPLLARSLERAATNLRPTPHSQVVYTDDWAPIEWITNDMVLSYVLFGDMSALQGEPAR